MTDCYTKKPKTKTKKTCSHCNEEFTAKKVDARFCSGTCRGNEWRTCKECRGQFETAKNHNADTCSECKQLQNKWPKRGSVKACEACAESFVVKEGRYSRTCGRKCAAQLRMTEGTHGNQDHTWQGKLKSWVKQKNREWKSKLFKCPQCGKAAVTQKDRRTKRGRCGGCEGRVSEKTIYSMCQKVDEWLRRSSKQCKACDNTARFNKHFCDKCIKQKRRDTRTTSNRKRCRKYGCEYQTGITITSIIARDGKKCHYCNVETVRWAGAWAANISTLDHVIPVSKGGGHTQGNVVIACGKCNTEKGDTVMSLF